MSKPGKVHPDDLLVLATLAERADYRHMGFTDRQVLAVSRGPATAEGLRFRTAWISPYAGGQPASANFFEQLESSAILHNSTLAPTSEWEPEPLNLLEKIRALADESGYRGQVDKGYRLAIDDVLELLNRELTE